MKYWFFGVLRKTKEKCAWTTAWGQSKIKGLNANWTLQEGRCWWDRWWSVSLTRLKEGGRKKNFFLLRENGLEISLWKFSKTSMRRRNALFWRGYCHWHDCTICLCCLDVFVHVLCGMTPNNCWLHVHRVESKHFVSHDAIWLVLKMTTKIGWIPQFLIPGRTQNRFHHEKRSVIKPCEKQARQVVNLRFPAVILVLSLLIWWTRDGKSGSIDTADHSLQLWRIIRGLAQFLFKKLFRWPVKIRRQCVDTLVRAEEELWLDNASSKLSTPSAVLSHQMNGSGGRKRVVQWWLEAMTQNWCLKDNNKDFISSVPKPVSSWHCSLWWNMLRSRVRSVLTGVVAMARWWVDFTTSWRILQLFLH